ncbi:hypothetical protein PISMIDRAFT_68112, partial [Pisolithus microcarpus 441]
GHAAVRKRLQGEVSRALQLPIWSKGKSYLRRLESGPLTLTFPKDTSERQPHRIAV